METSSATQPNALNQPSSTNNSYSNVRAEDGLQPNRWGTLYEQVIIPVASVFAVFVALLGIQLMGR
jgi:hypothetical protein